MSENEMLEKNETIKETVSEKLETAKEAAEETADKTLGLSGRSMENHERSH